MTNFEKLKADIEKMTVKEMSNFLSKCEHCFYCNVDCSGCSCDEGTIKWLESEVEEDG